MGNEIPTRSRLIVGKRDAGRCLRCGGPASEWAHRRRRNVANEHQHCPCNGALMCRGCHQGWAHSNPEAAREDGFMVSFAVEWPGGIPVKTWYGWLYLLCDGDIEFVVEGVNDDRPRALPMPYVRRGRSDAGAADPA